MDGAGQGAGVGSRQASRVPPGPGVSHPDGWPAQTESQGHSGGQRWPGEGSPPVMDGWQPSPWGPVWASLLWSAVRNDGDRLFPAV